VVVDVEGIHGSRGAPVLRFHSVGVLAQQRRLPRRPRQVDSSRTARSDLPPPPAPPSSTNGSPAAAPGRRRGNRAPRASSLPPAPLPSSFPLSSSSLAVDREKSPSGGGGQGVAGAVGFIGRRPRVSRQMDGRRTILGIRASATRRASRGAGAVGQRPWGRGASSSAPTPCITGGRQREKEMEKKG
jgi:hypothetical protein